MVVQQKTQRPVQFEITEQTRESVESWIKAAKLASSDASLSKPDSRVAAHIDAAIRACRTSLDRLDQS
jgi:hypothetical protein